MEASRGALALLLLGAGGSSWAGLDTEPGLDLYPPDQRKPAPQLEGSTLDGKPFTLADLSGKTVVVNVWGCWCAPCRAETPDLVRLADEEGRGRQCHLHQPADEQP